MFFTIEVPEGMSVDVAKYKLRRLARESIVFYILTPGEWLLDKFLKENYNIDLKSACYKLIQEAQFTASLNEVCIKFIGDENDKLARLITYGNGVIHGSSILRDMFRKE